MNRILLYIVILYSGLLVSCTEWKYSDSDRYPDAASILKMRDSSSLRFMVLSDWGYNGSDAQKSVAAQMAHITSIAGSDFVLTCGDNFQYMGVESDTSSLWKLNYENVYPDSAFSSPWYPALGNHDYYGHPEAEVAYSKLSNRWRMQDRFYTFVRNIDSHDSLRVIMLDTQGFITACSSTIDDSAQIGKITQYNWLRSILQNNSCQYTIVAGHHPVYSASPHHGDTPEMKKYILPLLNAYHVDWYLSGHDHNFEHARAVGDYSDFIVTGTGGTVCDFGTNDRTIKSFSALGFTYITVCSDTLKLYFVSNDGKIRYQCLKAKRQNK